MCHWFGMPKASRMYDCLCGILVRFNGNEGTGVAWLFGSEYLNLLCASSFQPLFNLVWPHLYVIAVCPHTLSAQQMQWLFGSQ